MVNVNQNCSRIEKRHCATSASRSPVCPHGIEPTDASPESCLTSAETPNREILKLVIHAWTIIRASSLSTLLPIHLHTSAGLVS